MSRAVDRGRCRAYSHPKDQVSIGARGAYAAAKAGVGAFSEVLMKEVGPLGIKVTIVEPGGFRTDFPGTWQTE
jgi:NAD(P)-dependent dehydrogenase (short-subunit alcohol dehydrogenase family)